MNHNDFLKKHRLKVLFSLTLLALMTRLSALSFVNKVIFDEVHFGKFITQYLKGEYFFDIHPPLGKLILFGIAKITKLSAETNFSSIGLEFPPDTPIGPMRFLPALAGALLVPLMFLFAESLSRSSRTGLIAAIIILFDNAFVVQSRLISLDMLMLLFILSAIYCYLKSGDSQNRHWLFLSGISAGLAISVKWIGLISLVVIYLSLGVKYIFDKGFRKKLSLRRISMIVVTLAIIPFIIYYFTFALHFKLLYKPGDGNAFMSQAFNAPFYAQDKPVNELPLFKKFTELNIAMYGANLQNLKHTYSSKWFTWPLMLRPVSYLHSSIGNNSVQNLTFLGNPFVWWLASLGMLTFALLFALKKFFPPRYKNIPEFSGAGIIILGYFISYMPFISISRCMFLYHYLPALTFAIIGTAVLLDRFLLPPLTEDREIPSPFPGIITLIAGTALTVLIARGIHLWYLPKEVPFLIGTFFILLSFLSSLFLYFGIKNIYKISYLWLIVLFFLVLGGFFLFMPLSYGLPIQQKTFDFYMWIRSWI